MESLAEQGPPEPLDLFLQRALEQVRGEAMFLIDPSGRLASWNEGVGQILGWTRHDWIGQPMEVIFTPEDVQAGVPQAELHQAARSGHADDDRWMQRRDGRRLFVRGTVTRLLDQAGQPVGFLKVLRDATAAQLAERERARLLASEGQARQRAEYEAASLTAAVDAIADGVFIGDFSGVQRCNSAALRLLDVGSVAEFQGDRAALVQRFRLRRERDGPLLADDELPFWAALAGQRVVLDLWATRPGPVGQTGQTGQTSPAAGGSTAGAPAADTGRDLSLHCAAGPIVVDGRVVGAVAVMSDRSEALRLRHQGHVLSRVQTALQERDAELRALTHGVRDYAIFTIDPGGRISSWHLGAERMKGYTAAEAIGMPFERLFTAEDQAAGRPAVEMAQAARDGEFKGDGQRLRRDGSLFDAAVVLTALRGQDGELLGFLKLTQDISQRRAEERQHEQILRDALAARTEAERTSHSKGEFLATISHELRTPLSAILGWAQVLERGVFDPDTVKHGLVAISRNARIQVQLIEDLLDMNRIESGQLRLDLQRIELGAVIAAAIDSALPAASSKGIGLRTVFSPDSARVMGDAARLQQALGNLLSNAIKFTPPGGQISVSLVHDGAQARIEVADTGQGIEPAFLARMFDRFQQQDASSTRRHGGLGLGLSIVRHLVALHGGTVQAHSAGTGHGATFTITLPSEAPHAHSPPITTVVPAADPALAVTLQRLDGVSVLLVDDEPDVRAVTARMLADAGAQVLSAASADEALRLLHEARPAVLLSDIAMPVVDGYELIRRVRRLPPEAGGRIPAAAFTAYVRPEDRQRALAAGYQMHLAKPVPPQLLVGAVALLAQQAGVVQGSPPGQAVGPDR